MSKITPHNGKKDKDKAYSQSDIHVQASEAFMLAERVGREGTIVQQLQQITDGEKIKNRAAVKALIRCPHFLACQHIAHSTNSEKLVSLVVACGGEDLKTYLESAGKNAMYTSRIAVTEFFEALGTWVEESLLKHLHQAPFYSIMADECTDVSTVEELSLFCRWIENGEPTDHFIDLLPMKKTDAESVYSVLVECLKSKNIQLSNHIVMGFNGAATFSGKKSGVQARRKSTHFMLYLFIAIVINFNWLVCTLQKVQRVYVTLTTLWKFFYYSPKRAQSLKEVQKVLDFPELKIFKPSHTRWLAHERCVRAIKASYSAIITALDHIYSESHEPEALGLKKVFSRNQQLQLSIC